MLCPKSGPRLESRIVYELFIVHLLLVAGSLTSIFWGHSTLSYLALCSSSPDISSSFFNYSLHLVVMDLQLLIQSVGHLQMKNVQRNLSHTTHKIQYLFLLFLVLFALHARLRSIMKHADVEVPIALKPHIQAHCASC